MGDSASNPRWRGQPGRLEVWYATATDTATGTGLWLHHERVAPTAELNRDPYVHGWIGLFPPGGSPVLERFGPQPAPAPNDDPEAWVAIDSTRSGPDGFSGSAGGLSWQLRVDGGNAPIWTMPRSAWEREVLPAAQVVAMPKARFRGSVAHHSRSLDFDGVGNVAHIYGHGNAQIGRASCRERV